MKTLGENLGLMGKTHGADQLPEPGKRLQDTEVERTGDSSATCCGFACTAAPLGFIAVFVILLDIAEACIALYPLHWARWENAWVAGIVLKLFLLETLLWMAEGVLKSKSFSDLCLK